MAPHQEPTTSKPKGHDQSTARGTNAQTGAHHATPTKIKVPRRFHRKRPKGVMSSQPQARQTDTNDGSTLNSAAGGTTLDRWLQEDVEDGPYNAIDLVPSEPVTAQDSHLPVEDIPSPLGYPTPDATDHNNE